MSPARHGAAPAGPARHHAAASRMAREWDELARINAAYSIVSTAEFERGGAARGRDVQRVAGEAGLRATRAEPAGEGSRPSRS